MFLTMACVQLEIDFGYDFGIESSLSFQGCKVMDIFGEAQGRGGQMWRKRGRQKEESAGREGCKIKKEVGMGERAEETMK